MSTGGTLNHALLIGMVTDVAPALVARGVVSVHWYGADVILRLDSHPLMSFHCEHGHALAAGMRKIFEL